MIEMCVWVCTHVHAHARVHMYRLASLTEGLCKEEGILAVDCPYLNKWLLLVVQIELLNIYKSPATGQSVFI